MDSSYGNEQRQARLADMGGGFVLPPLELEWAVRQYFPLEESINAINISWLESGWDPFALNDTTTPFLPCGATVDIIDGVRILAERSVGLFQINSCNFPTWEWQRLYNVQHNVGTAHMIWEEQGWRAWYFSAHALGLI